MNYYSCLHTICQYIGHHLLIFSLFSYISFNIFFSSCFSIIYSSFDWKKWMGWVNLWNTYSHSTYECLYMEFCVRCQLLLFIRISFVDCSVWCCCRCMVMILMMAFNYYILLLVTTTTTTVKNKNSLPTLVNECFWNQVNGTTSKRCRQ